MQEFLHIPPPLSNRLWARSRSAAILKGSYDLQPSLLCRFSSLFPSLPCNWLTSASSALPWSRSREPQLSSNHCQSHYLLPRRYRLLSRYSNCLFITLFMLRRHLYLLTSAIHSMIDCIVLSSITSRFSMTKTSFLLTRSGAVELGLNPDEQTVQPPRDCLIIEIPRLHWEYLTSRAPNQLQRTGENLISSTSLISEGRMGSVFRNYTSATFLVASDRGRGVLKTSWTGPTSFVCLWPDLR